MRCKVVMGRAQKVVDRYRRQKKTRTAAGLVVSVGSGPGLDLGPGPGACPLGIPWQRLQGVKRAHCRIGRV